MRPSSTRRSTPSSATVVPKALRSPRASMLAMISALLLPGVRFRQAALAGFQQLSRREAEALDGGEDPGPLLVEELLALALQQQLARPGVDEHAAAPPALHELLVHQLLVALQDREGI